MNEESSILTVKDIGSFFEIDDYAVQINKVKTLVELKEVVEHWRIIADDAHSEVIKLTEEKLNNLRIKGKEIIG